MPPAAPLDLPLDLLGRSLMLLLVALACLFASQRLVVRNARIEEGRHPDAAPSLPPVGWPVLALLLGASLGPWPAAAALGLVLSTIARRRADVGSPPFRRALAALAHGLAAACALSLGATALTSWSGGDSPLAGLLRVLDPAPELGPWDVGTEIARMAPAVLGAVLIGALDPDRPRGRWWPVGLVALLLVGVTALLVHDRPWRARWGGQVDAPQHFAAVIVAIVLMRLLLVTTSLPAPAARSAVWACAALLPAVMLFEATDSCALQVPLAVTALVTGRAPPPRWPDRAGRSLASGKGSAAAPSPRWRR